MSASARPAFDGVGESPCPGGEGGEEQVDPGGEFGVALFGGLFPVVDTADIGFDLVEEGVLVPRVFLVEGVVHGTRVDLSTLLAVLCDLWSGLPRRDRDVWSVLLPLGCLFFLVLGACLR